MSDDRREYLVPPTLEEKRLQRFFDVTGDLGVDTYDAAIVLSRCLAEDLGADIEDVWESVLKLCVKLAPADSA